MTKVVTLPKASQPNTGTVYTPKLNNVAIPRRREEVCLKETVKVIIPADLYAKIRQLCKTINTVEWSGPLFYKVDGDLSDIPNMTVTCLDILPLDKGSSAYTEYTMDGDVLAYMLDEITETPFEDIKIGHCHSHNSMAVFFSGTDQSELHDNAPNHNVYLSLIVNNKGDYDCRLAYIGEAGTTTTVECLNVDGTPVTFSSSKAKKEVLVWHDCEVIEEVTTEPVSESYMERITTLDKSKPTFNYMKTTYPSRTYFNPYSGESDIYDDYPVTARPGITITPKKKIETTKQDQNQITLFSTEEEREQVIQVVLSMSSITESCGHMTDLSTMVGHLGKNLHNLSSKVIVDRIFDNFVACYNEIFKSDPDRLQKNLYMFRLSMMLEYIEEEENYLPFATYKEIYILEGLKERFANVILEVEKRKQ